MKASPRIALIATVILILISISGWLAIMAMTHPDVPWTCDIIRQESSGAEIFYMDGYSLTVFRDSIDSVRSWKKSVVKNVGKDWQSCPIVVSSYPIHDVLPAELFSAGGGQAIAQLSVEGELERIYYVDNTGRCCWIYSQW